MPKLPDSLKNPVRNFALIPAAGIGTRIGGDMPKQYLPLNGKPMLAHVLETLSSSPLIEHVYVVAGRDDAFIKPILTTSALSPSRISILRVGGASRHASVVNGLNAMAGAAAENDWVLVHDAARPGLTGTMVQKLIYQLASDAVGGLLAMPMVDTVKRADGNCVMNTISRDNLWTAQTPQMFRYGLLKRALIQATEVTDEASAIEQLGLRPRLVEGSARNFKVTLPGDFSIMEALITNIPEKEKQ